MRCFSDAIKEWKAISSNPAEVPQLQSPILAEIFTTSLVRKLKVTVNLWSLAPFILLINFTENGLSIGDVDNRINHDLQYKQYKRTPESYRNIGNDYISLTDCNPDPQIRYCNKERHPQNQRSHPVQCGSQFFFWQADLDNEIVFIVSPAFPVTRKAPSFETATGSLPRNSIILLYSPAETIAVRDCSDLLYQRSKDVFR